MRFDQFLTRAGDEVLQELLGAKALRLLRALDPKGFNQSRQRELLIEQVKPQTLLSTKKTRSLLLDLLRPAEAAQLCQVLGFETDDAYYSLAKGNFSGDRLVGLLEFFELSPMVETPAEISPAIQTIEPRYALFKHQILAAARTTLKLNTGARRVMLHMPTGSGKTRTAMNIIAEQLRLDPTKAVIWLAHSEELCEQAAAEFEKAWSSLGSFSTRVHRYWGQRSLSTDEIGGDFIVAGLPKMHATVRRDISFIGRLGARSTLVVMDEAHQAIAPTYQLILDALVEPFPKTSLLGLSATPGRTWNDPNADEQLTKYFARQKVMLEVDGYANPVDYLVEHQYLAKTEFHPVFLKTGIALSDADLLRIETDFEIPSDILERLAEDEMRNLGILAEIEKLIERHRRIIVFATTVEHSDLLAYTLRARGIWAKSVTGATLSADRQASLDGFKADFDEPRVLCNFGVLTTGFDAPRTSAALIARPTVSLVLYSQMVGRAIRGKRAGGNATAEIVTVVDSDLPGFGDVGSAFTNWEDVWGS